MVIGLAATVIALHLAPGTPAPWVTAGPLLVAGIGSGLVITPNQTIAPGRGARARGPGSGAGMLQTGQRIGAAAGIAAVGSVFFAASRSRRGDWTNAFERYPMLATGIIALALVCRADRYLRRVTNRPQN